MEAPPPLSPLLSPLQQQPLFLFAVSLFLWYFFGLSFAVWLVRLRPWPLALPFLWPVRPPVRPPTLPLPIVLLRCHLPRIAELRRQHPHQQRQRSKASNSSL